MRLVLIFIILLSNIYANDINKLFQELHNAPIDKKYIIMNKIKTNISKMNNENRAKHIGLLKKHYLNKAHKNNKNFKNMNHNLNKVKNMIHNENTNKQQKNINKKQHKNK